jgi:hypothetical protein
MMMMQQAMPMDKPIVLMMLCSLSLRSNLIANIKKFENIDLWKLYGLFGVACFVLRVNRYRSLAAGFWRLAV